jgi:hypothetical protein
MAHAVLEEGEVAYTRNVALNPTFQIISQYPKIPVERMEFDDFVLVFNSPYKINIRKENEYFIHEDPQLDMTCWGKTLEELFDAVFEEFYVLWKDIGLVQQPILLNPAGFRLLNKSRKKLRFLPVL